MRHYLERFTKAFAAYEGPKPRATYHDSFEYLSNWSPDLLAEFAKRRGRIIHPSAFNIPPARWHKNRS